MLWFPFLLFFVRILYYGIGFPIAHMYSKNFIEKKETLKKIIEVMKDPFFISA